MTSPMRSALTLLVLACAISGIGCAPVPQSSGTWTGHIVSRSVRTDPGRNDPKIYQAASLLIATGPDIASEADHGWLPSPILVDEDGKILDPAAFDSSDIVQVKGVAARLWTATDSDGNQLYYDPLTPVVMPVGNVIHVEQATDSKGHPVRLYVAEHSQPATTTSPFQIPD